MCTGMLHQHSRVVLKDGICIFGMRPGQWHAAMSQLCCLACLGRWNCVFCGFNPTTSRLSTVWLQNEIMTTIIRLWFPKQLKSRSIFSEPKLRFKSALQSASYWTDGTD